MAGRGEQKKHKCNKCGHEQMYGPHDNHNPPFFLTDAAVCSKCWDKSMQKFKKGLNTAIEYSEKVEYEYVQANRAELEKIVETGKRLSAEFARTEGNK